METIGTRTSGAKQDNGSYVVAIERDEDHGKIVKVCLTLPIGENSGAARTALGELAETVLDDDNLHERLWALVTELAHQDAGREVPPEQAV